MDRKSLFTGIAMGTLVGSLVAGSLAFAATTNVVQAQQEAVNYSGVHGTALVYGGTTYAELYAVQQVLKKQGIVNQWDGMAKNFSMDSPSQSNKVLALQNQQLSEQMGSLNSILKNIQNLPNSVQQQLLSTVAQTASSGSSASQQNVALQTIAQGLQKAVTEVTGNPGKASSVLQNLLNGVANGSQKSGSSTNPGSTSTSGTSTSGTTTSGTSTSGTSTSGTSTSGTSTSGTSTSGTSTSGTPTGAVYGSQQTSGGTSSAGSSTIPSSGGTSKTGSPMGSGNGPGPSGQSSGTK
ncbi:MAG: hypothetical protein ACYCYO_04365 [Bacilli bacterium]